MKKILIIIIGLSSIKSVAQSSPKVDSTLAKNGYSKNGIIRIGEAEPKQEVFTRVEKMPEFPGGPSEMYKFISKNQKYPSKERNDDVSGVVYVTFVVDTLGKLRDAKVLKGVAGGPGLDAEALRVVNIMPAWIPGTLNNKKVNVQFNLPFKFKLG